MPNCISHFRTKYIYNSNVSWCYSYKVHDSHFVNLVYVYNFHISLFLYFPFRNSYICIFGTINFVYFIYHIYIYIKSLSSARRFNSIQESPYATRGCVAQRAHAAVHLYIVLVCCNESNRRIDLHYRLLIESLNSYSYNEINNYLTI